MGLCLNVCVLLASVCAPSAGGTSGTQSLNNDPWWVQQERLSVAARHETLAAEPQQASEAESARGRGHNKSHPLASATKVQLGKLKELVSRCGYQFAQMRTNHFYVIYRDQRCPDAVLHATGDLLERAYKQFYAGFGKAGFTLKESGESLQWIIFDQQDQYRDFARVADGMDSPYLESYYSAHSNEVVLMQVAASLSSRYGWPSSHRGSSAAAGELSGMDQQPYEVAQGGSGMLDVRRAVHEAAHQLAFNSGLQKRGVIYPLWVSEGLATNFETDSPYDLGVARDNAPRRRQLMRAWSGGRLMPLSEFATMVQITPSQARSANDLYAQAWALFNFMFQTRPAQLRQYLSKLSAQDPGPKDESVLYEEICNSFGSMRALDAAWQAYLRAAR